MGDGKYGSDPAQNAIEYTAASRRRRFPRALTELHHELRTAGDTPARTGWAVGLGTAVGAMPVYGGHLALCLLLSRMFRLSPLKTYLAAHINNPFTAPWLLYSEFGIGRLVTGGEWPGFSVQEVRSLTVWGLGRDLFIGSVVFAVLGGVVLGATAYAISVRWMRSSSLIERLREVTCRRYVDAGILHWEFVRGKLKHDPLYFDLLLSGRLPNDGRIVDLGCGRGILLALLDTARRFHRSGSWDPDRPPPPLDVGLNGVEIRPELADVARRAMRGAGRIEIGDLAGYAPAASRAVLMLDVLHYLSAERQEQAIRRAVEALQEGGVILIREPDAGGGVRFILTRASERLCALLRLDWRQRFHYRSATEWRELLERCGLSVRTVPLSRGTPFANVLVEARTNT